MRRFSDAPNRWTRLTAPNRAPGAASGLVCRRWRSITRRKICSTALSARGSRSRYQRKLHQAVENGVLGTAAVGAGARARGGDGNGGVRRVGGRRLYKCTV